MKEVIEVEAALRLALEALEDWNSPLDPQPDADIITAIKEVLAQQNPQGVSNEGFGYNTLKPYAFEAPNGELRKTAEAKDASEWGTKFKPLYEQQSNEQVEPVAVVDANDDGYFAEILPDRSVKVGQFLFAHPPVPYVTESRTAQPKEPEQEPVAHTLNCVCGAVWDIKADGSEEIVHTPDTTPPYVAMPRQRKPLTDGQVTEIYNQVCKDWTNRYNRPVTFARTIEASHGIYAPTGFKENT